VTAMRRPSVRNPRSIWDVLAVLAAYALLEYVVLQVTGSSIVRGEFVVVGIAVLLWTVWATLRVLDESQFGR
jgi:hypothetical protein